ncbi:MAG: hypothetical protein ABIJ04_11415 [Bacteroidota bacterium]
MFTLNSKNFWLRITGTIFGIVALIHLARIATGVPVLIGCWLLPVWVNWMGMVATAFLFIWLWRLSFGGEKPE